MDNNLGFEPVSDDLGFEPIPNKIKSKAVSEPEPPGALAKIRHYLDYPASVAAGGVGLLANALQNSSKGVDWLRQYMQGKSPSNINTQGMEFLDKNKNFQQQVMPWANPTQQDMYKGADTIFKGAAALSPIALGGLSVPAVLGSGLTSGMTSKDNPVMEGLVGLAGAGGIKGASNLGATVLAGNRIKTGLSPQELARNLRITKGTKTNLGDVIENPIMKRYFENVLAKHALTGAGPALVQSAAKVRKAGEGILDGLRGKASTENPEKELFKGLQSSHAEARNIKELHYEDANKIADSLNFSPELTNFKKAVKDNLDDLKQNEFLKQDSKVKSLMGKLSGYKKVLTPKDKNSQILDQFGRPIVKPPIETPVSLKDAGLLKGRLNELSASAASSPDSVQRLSSGLFGRLSSALKQDLDSSMTHPKFARLKKAYDKAEKFYGKSYAPYLDKDVYPFVQRYNPKSSDELLSTFIKTGKATDQQEKIDKLANLISPDKKNLLSYTYLKRALDRKGKLDPDKLGTLLSPNSLGPRQYKALFPDPEVRKQIDDYSSLVKMNKKGLNAMLNPMTGQQNTTPSKFNLLKLPHRRAAAHFLTSEKVRDKLVSGLIKAKSKKAKNMLGR